MLKLVESLELLPPQFIIFLDTVLIMFTAERLVCYPFLTVLAYVRFKKKKNQQTNKKTQPKKPQSKSF